MKTFIDMVLSGDRSLDDVDDFIEEGHNGTCAGTLPNSLGVSLDEYLEFLKDENYLRKIVEKRRNTN